VGEFTSGTKIVADLTGINLSSPFFGDVIQNSRRMENLAVLLQKHRDLHGIKILM
jgi:hypothetical protein